MAISNLWNPGVLPSSWSHVHVHVCVPSSLLTPFLPHTPISSPARSPPQTMRDTVMVHPPMLQSGPLGALSSCIHSSLKHTSGSGKYFVS